MSRGTKATEGGEEQGDGGEPTRHMTGDNLM